MYRKHIVQKIQSLITKHGNNKVNATVEGKTNICFKIKVCLNQSIYLTCFFLGSCLLEEPDSKTSEVDSFNTVVDDTDVSGRFIGLAFFLPSLDP